MWDSDRRLTQLEQEIEDWRAEREIERQKELELERIHGKDFRRKRFEETLRRSEEFIKEYNQLLEKYGRK